MLIYYSRVNRSIYLRKSNRTRLWQLGRNLPHGLNKQKQAGNTGAYHSTDGNRPKVLRCTKHSDRPHDHRDYDRVVAEAQHELAENTSDVVRGDEQKDDCHADELQIGGDNHYVTGDFTASLLRNHRKRLAGVQ